MPSTMAPKADAMDAIRWASDQELRKVPETIFQRERFLIMKILSQHGEVEFRELKHDLQLSDGNLASHLRALERAKFVDFEKSFVGRRSRTTYRLTPTGLTTFQTLVYYLRGALEDITP